MNIIKNGSKVLIKEPNIKGLVTACNIRGIEPNVRLSYEVTWWVGGEQKCEYLESYEIELYNVAKKKAGLVNYDKELIVQ